MAQSSARRDGSIAVASAPVAAPAGYPARPLRLVAGTSPGGVTDLLARMASAALARALGQNVVVDNRPGATGNVAIELVAKSPFDGHTLLMISGGNIVIAPYLYRLPVDPVNDLLPLFNMAEAPHLPGGALKPLAVSSPRRLAGIPEVPTSAEAGLPEWQMTTWFGVFAPKGTSPGIASFLNAKLQQVIDDPKGRQRLMDFGCEPVGGSMKSFAELVRSDYRLWGGLVREAGVKLE